MQVNPTQSAAIEMGGVQEVQDFMMLGHPGCGQRCQKGQDLLAPPEIAARQLTQHERMAENLVIGKKRLKAGTPRSQVLDPDRGVNQDHAAFLARRRRTSDRLFSVPPSSARRRALSRAIRDSSPRRTRAVFSSTPASLAALCSRASSMFNVVLICMNMHQTGISVKLPFGACRSVPARHSGCSNRSA